MYTYTSLNYVNIIINLHDQQYRSRTWQQWYSTGIGSVPGQGICIGTCHVRRNSVETRKYFVFSISSWRHSSCSWWQTMSQWGIVCHQLHELHELQEPQDSPRHRLPPSSANSQISWGGGNIFYDVEKNFFAQLCQKPRIITPKNWSQFMC